MAKRRATPIRAHLLENSSLQPEVVNGLQALNGGHRDYIDLAIRDWFGDSLALDEALRVGHEQENRWDYLLGVSEERAVVGLEPHAARQGEISTVAKKCRAAREQLRGHLRPGARVCAWFWVASGKNYFADTEKARVSLDQAGVTFVSPRLKEKHLAATRQKRP